MKYNILLISFSLEKAMPSTKHEQPATHGHDARCLGYNVLQLLRKDIRIRHPSTKDCMKECFVT